MDTDTDPKFSDVCGENIDLSENRKRARWRHKYSAGRLFASRPMREDEQLDVLLDGSGHVGIGIIKSDPGELNNLREDGTGNCKPKLVTDIRVHKRECSVNIKQRQEEKATKVDINYLGQKVVVKVNKDEKFWLTFELKFGSVVVRFGSPDICFHPHSGRNTRFLDKDRRSAKLDVEYPAVTCCLWRKLHVNEYVTFSVLPLKDGEKDPSTYHVVLGVSQLDATQLRSRDPESFRSDSRVPIPYRWKVINRFDKDVCYGEVRVGIGPNRKIRAFHSGGFETEMDIDPEVKCSQYLFLLSLFRTEVRIKDLVVEETHYDYALHSFRKASTKSKSESYYIDIIGDDVPLNCEEQNEQELRKVKSRSYPMASQQTGNDQRTSLDIRPRQLSDNYYDDVAVGIPNKECMDDAVYNDVINDTRENSESNIVSDQHSIKSERHYDEIDIQSSVSPKSAKKTNKSPLILRKPVSKLMDKVAGIKNVFVKRAEHPYDEVDDPAPAHDLGSTLRSVHSGGSDVVEDTYWEVKEIPRVEKDKEPQPVMVKSESEDSAVSCNSLPKNSRLKNNRDTSSGVSESLQTMQISENQTDNKTPDSKDRQTDGSVRDAGKSPEIASDEESSGNSVNVKLLIQKFGGNEHAHTCAVRQRNIRTPLLHTSPSAPVLANRSNSDESLAHSRSQATLHDKGDPAAETNKKSALLSDTFDSINVLLNIGKGKKRRDKNKQKLVRNRIKTM